jgi:predicted porin
MTIRHILAGTASAVALSLASQGASAFGMMEVGDWQVEFGGNVNAYLTSVDCENGGTATEDHDNLVHGGLACGSLAGDREFGDIRTGLLPSWLGFHAIQEKDGFKQGITIGFQPGADGGNQNAIAGAPIDGGLGLNSANFRQVFIEFSGEDWGGFKIGRDLGLFGSDAILSDMTLLGVGTVSDLTQGGGNTSLGRIGVGYMYADWKGQVQYTSPNWEGFQFNLAIVDPWGAVNLSGDSLNAATFEQKGDTYGFEGKLGYTWEGDFAGKIWASFITQALDTTSTAFDSQDATGFDIGGKISFSGFEAVGYWYSGEGIGTTDFLFDGLDFGGETRDSDGMYVQLTYKVPTSGTKLGVSWGESNLDRGPNDLATTSLVETNESIVLGVYHPLTDALHLVVEYTNTEATAHNGNEAEEKSLALGAIMFY